MSFLSDTIFSSSESLNYFNFATSYKAFVIDNSMFETENRIKIFIPELFGFFYDGNVTTDVTVIDKSKFTNHIDLKLGDKIIKDYWLYSYPIIDRLDRTNINLLSYYDKPNVGDSVLVKFYNQDPKHCMYSNAYIPNEDIIINNKVFETSYEITTDCGHYCINDYKLLKDNWIKDNRYNIIGFNYSYTLDIKNYDNRLYFKIHHSPIIMYTDNISRFIDNGRDGLKVFAKEIPTVDIIVPKIEAIF